VDRSAPADGLPQAEELVGAGVGRAKGALSVRPFRRLYTALVLSSFGDWLGFLATTALATQLVDSFESKAYATGGVLVFRLLPAVLFGPIAGAFADRWDRRLTMVTCDLMRFSLFLSIPLVGAGTNRHTSLLYLLIASFFIETVSLFWIPAKEASVPNMVGPDRLEGANQLTLIATYGSAPVAAAVFALLSLVSRALGSGFEYFRTGPVDLALFVNAATFLFAAMTVFRLEIPGGRGRGSDTAVPRLSTSLREGLRFMGGTPLARGLLVGMLGALAAGGAIIALGKLFAESVLAGGNAAYGLLFGSMFLGIALGVALGPRLLGSFSRRRAFGPSIVGAGAALVFMALVPNLFLVTMATVLVGAFAGLAYVIGLTLLGLEVTDDMRGRMFGLVQSLMRIDLLLVTATTPFIAGKIGVRQGPYGISINGVAVVLLAGGVLAILVGVLAFRQMDDRRGVRLHTDLLSLVRRTTDTPSYAGVFLALEGGEGAGKSTQAKLLLEWLQSTGREVVLTREPGATPTGQRIRTLLLDPATGGISPRAEALLYAADRAQHVAHVILPALERGAVVVTDRYVDSSLAYQGAGRALELAEVARLSRWATGGLRPDLTLLLDIDPAVGLRRISGAPDRIELESLAFHQRVRQGFLELAAADPDRYLVVPATDPPEAVHASVRARVEAMLPVREAPLPEAARS
jgi:dTMP kinase